MDAIARTGTTPFISCVTFLVEMEHFQMSRLGGFIVATAIAPFYVNTCTGPPCLLILKTSAFVSSCFDTMYGENREERENENETKTEK